MEIRIRSAFSCDESVRPFLSEVLQGEYDINVFLYGPKIVDLGANVGAFSVWASHRFPGCKIQAYEPNLKLIPELKNNLRFYPNVTVIPKGVGVPGVRTLHDGPNNPGESTLFQISGRGRLKGQEVEIIDPLQLPECDILKLDIEGAELEVLGPLLTAGRRPSVILYEFHNHPLREKLDELLTKDYYLISASVTNLQGLGVMKWLRKDLLA